MNDLIITYSHYLHAHFFVLLFAIKCNIMSATVNILTAWVSRRKT